MHAISRARLFLAASLSLLLSPVASSAQLTVGEFATFEQVSSRRVSRFVTEFEYRARVSNGTPALQNVTATVTSASPHVTVLDAELAFGDVSDGESVASIDTFSFQHDRRYPFDPGDLEFVFQFDVVPVNAPPVADAGPDQTVFVTERVTLDGSGSSDADGDPLSFRWMLASVPPGSTAALSNPFSTAPSFVADVTGTYVLELIVNDGSDDSAPDTVVIDTESSPPVADAGPDQTVFVTDVATLDGSGSFDVDGDPLTFFWSLTGLPSGSIAQLSDPTAVAPSFDVDLTGTYVVELVVNDGALDSAPDTVVIDTENSPPIANAGPDQTVLVTETAILDGSASADVDGDPLAFFWSLTSRPPGSLATLSDATAVMPRIVVDLPGRYVAQLIVNDGLVDGAPDTVTVDTENSPPAADAGPDQTAFVLDRVTLDGSGSSDVDGDALSYIWSLVAVPFGSAASLSDPASVTPSFDIDLPGSYVAQLLVNDGTVDGAPDTVRVDTENSVPVADAGADQTVLVGERVALDGSNSSDVDGDALRFSWSLAARPQGSAASLSDASAVTPSFDVDLPGTYVVQLVVNDGAVDSPPDTATVDTENSPPVADAGPDQTAFVTDTVSLDGSGSSDVDGDLLTLRWSFIARPAGSGATLSNASATRPSFEVDLPGSYIVQLIVDDGTVASAPDNVAITTTNSAPVADAGPDQVVRLTETVTLDGSGSADVDGDPLLFSWSLASVPAGSAADLDDPSAVQPTFVADRAGTYVAQLVVNDGDLDSRPNNVLIVTENSPPVANAGGDQTVALGGSVHLDGSLSSDVDADPLTYRWTLVSVPTGSGATLSDEMAVGPTFVGDVAGDYVAELVVNDGALDSAPDTVTVTVDSAPSMTAFSRTIGAGLQFVDGARLEVATHGGVTVRIESSDPAVALVAPDGVTPGAAFLEVFVPDGSDFAPYAVQGVFGASGTVNVTASAPGFTPGNGAIEIVPAALLIFGLPATTSVGMSREFTVLSGLPNGDGTNLSSFQGLSAGNVPPLEVMLTSSDGSVAQLTGGGTTASTVTLPTTPGEFQYHATLAPLLAGNTTVSGHVPGFATTASASREVTVTAPTLTPFSRTIGAGLQFLDRANLGVANHGGVTVRIESSNPAVALVAPDGVTPGAPFIDVFVPDGSSRAPYAVQGVAGSMGTASVTASAPGFANGAGTINVVQAAIMFTGLPSMVSLGGSRSFTILSGVPNGAGNGLSSFQALSAGNVPPLELTLTSSDGAVGQWTNGASTMTLPIAPGQFQIPATFVPVAIGTTTVSGSIPGFLTTTSASVPVTVNP